MRLLIDTNVLLDVLQERHPHYAASLRIWQLCELGTVEGYLSTLTFANIVYVMRRELTPEKIEQILNVLSLVFHFADFIVFDIMKAAKLKWNDFEDAAQSATAARVGADYIITRNTRDFQNCRITALTPMEYLLKI